MTNFSLLSFFITPCKNPSLCFNSASIRAISASTSIMLPNGTAYSVVPTMKEEAPSALLSTTVIEERLHIFWITALNYATTLGGRGFYVSMPWLSRFWMYFPVPLAGVAMIIFEIESLYNHIKSFFVKEEM